MNPTGEFPLGFSSSERKPMDVDSVSLSSDSSSCSPPAAPVTSSRKRSRTASEQKQIRLPQRKGGLQLWQFLYALLENPAQYGELIEWTDRRSELEFRMLEPEALAAWWGYIKHRPNMSYERLSRSLRFYYDKGILRKMGGERFLYKFCVSPEAMYEHIGNSDNRPSLKFVPAVVQQRMSKYVQQHQPSLFYPHCYQQQQSYPAPVPAVSQYSSYTYDQSSHSLPTSLNPPAVRPRLYSHELLSSTPSLPTYEDHLARSNSYPLSLTDTTASNYPKTDDFSFMQHSASSSESCSPRSSTSEMVQVDMVMQEILQLTDKYSNSIDIKPRVNSFTLFDSHSQAEEDLFKTPTCGDDAPVFPTMSASSLPTSSQFSQTAGSMWYYNTIY